MSIFTSSDYYVLKSAIDRAVLEAKPLMRVRTETLIEIGAAALIPASDMVVFEAMEDEIKERHAVEVSVHALKTIMETVECPKDEDIVVPAE